MEVPNSLGNSITSKSNRDWLFRHELKIRRYLRQFHDDRDWETVANLLYWYFPDEGRKLIENFDLSDDEKKNIFMDYLEFSPQVTFLIFADERMGKDALVCKIIQDIIDRCVREHRIPPRVVTLMNVKCPPFVVDSDMYFSFKDIPSGKLVYNDYTKKMEMQEVWIYCSELEIVLPARNPLSPENSLFATISGTFAQNHVKLLGCVKLASKVDLNAIRGCNIKAFKYINPEKLEIANVERANILSPLGAWLLPRDRNKKESTLLAFDNQLFSIDYDLPFWWTQDYSEQFNNIPESKIWDYIDAVCLDMKAPAIHVAVTQKFRNKTISVKQIQEHLDSVLSS